MSILEYLKVGALTLIIGYGVALKIDNMQMEMQLHENEIAYKQRVQEIEKANSKLRQNLKDVENEQVEQLRNAADNALINYRAAFPVSMCNPVVSVGTVPGIAKGNATDDAAIKESVVAHDAFITACATDAAIIGIWQRWATLNGITVGE